MNSSLNRILSKLAAVLLLVALAGGAHAYLIDFETFPGV